MKWTLSMRCAEEPQRPTVAWFIPGETAEEWLDALALLPFDARTAQLAVVPRSGLDRRPMGALAFGQSGNSQPHVPTRFHPYGCFAGRLYLPVEAVVSPPVDEQELDELLGHDQVYVWHPTAGLIPYSEANLFAPARLLQAPSESSADWNLAVAGTACNLRLLSLSAESAPTLQELIEEVRGDIGTQAASAHLLPASPREAAPGWMAAVQRGAMSAVAKATLWLSGGAQSESGASMRRFLLRAAMIVGAVMIAAFLFFARDRGASAPQTTNAPTSSPSTPPASPPVTPAPPPMGVPVIPWGLGGLWPVALGIGLFLFSLLASRANRGPDNPTPARKAAPSLKLPGFGWLSGLQAWAAAKLQAITAALEAARHRELERLLTLMDKDPDEGLRYALPLTADALRQVGAPGAKLLGRVVDYGAGVTGPVDPWHIQEEYRRRLTLRYRELADREIALGRHRRAAYIYAELLGDWQAAAATLRDGGHYREAAVVFDERLRKPLDAAQCLEQGGLVPEAIVIYERLRMHETVGDLHVRLEQPEEADRSYRLAVDDKRAANDRLGAAHLLEGKLCAPEEAWTEIADGWPDSPQAQQCLHEAFSWTVRHRDPERASEHILRIAQEASDTRQIAQVVAKTSELATQYPEPSVRDAAVATTLAVASNRLPNAADVELHALTSAVQRLAADDKLLSRDCDRYVRERTGDAPPATKRPAQGNAQKPRHTSKFPFENVRACIAAHDAIYAAGWRNHHLFIARANWRGQFQQPHGPPWPYPSSRPETEILLAAGRAPDEVLCVHAVGQASAGYRRAFASIDEFPRAVIAGDFAGCSPMTEGIQSAGEGFVTIGADIAKRTILLVRYRGAGPKLIGTESVLVDKGVTFSQDLPFQVRDGVCYLAANERLCSVRGGKLVEVAKFHEPVVRLVAAPDEMKPRLVASFESGARIVWGVTPGVSSACFAKDLFRPHVLLHPSGHLIAADRRRCEVYRIHDFALRLHAQLELEDLGELVAILPPPIGKTFAICDESGHLRQFAIPD